MYSVQQDEIKSPQKTITPILAIKIDDGNYSRVGVYVTTDILSREGAI